MSTLAIDPAELATQAAERAESWERVKSALETLETHDLPLLLELIGPQVEAPIYALGSRIPDPELDHSAGGLDEELADLEAELDGDRSDRSDREAPAGPVDPGTPAAGAPPTSPPASERSAKPSTSSSEDLSETEACYLAAVKDSPGLSGTAYGRKLGKGQGHASRNLRALVSKGRIREEAKGGGKSYWPTDAQGAEAKKRKPAAAPRSAKQKAEDDAAPKTDVERRIVDWMREHVEPASIAEIQDGLGERDLGLVVGALKRRGCVERVEGIPGIPLFCIAEHLAEVDG